jgi:hypothetical protein
VYIVLLKMTAVPKIISYPENALSLSSMNKTKEELFLFWETYTYQVREKYFLRVFESCFCNLHCGSFLVTLPEFLLILIWELSEEYSFLFVIKNGMSLNDAFFHMQDQIWQQWWVFTCRVSLTGEIFPLMLTL